jgi:hypothetical protein
VAEKRTVVTKSDETGTFVTTEQKVRVWMQVIVSFVVLLSGIAILTSPNFLFATTMDEGMKKFAAGWVGAVIGYWLY